MKVLSLSKNYIKPNRLNAKTSFGSRIIPEPLTNRSKNLDYKFFNKDFSVVSLPFGLKIIDDKFVLRKKTPTIAIIDTFKNPGNIQIADGVKVSHGQLVSKYATSNLENEYGILAFNIVPSSITNPHKALKEALEELVEMQRKFKNVQTLNLSVGEFLDFTFLSKKSGLNLTSQNAYEKRNEILEFIKNSKEERFKFIFSQIQAINNLVDEGVEVYLASGNIGDKGLNLLSLSKAQHIVCADDYSDATRFFSTESANAFHTFQKKYDENGILVKIFDDRIAFTPQELDLKLKKKSIFSRIKKEYFYTIYGTSYSSPSKMNDDLINKKK